MYKIFLEVLINYILPVIYTSTVSLVFVLFFLFIFRIKDSNLRILFFFIPLIKPFIVITERIDAVGQFPVLKSGMMGLRFPDPNNIISSFKVLERGPEVASGINHFILLIVLTSIIFILLFRWITLMAFYRKLSFGDRVGRKEVPEIYDIVDKFAGKIKMDTPSISLTHKEYFSPFVTGIKNHTIVLSPNLMEKLNRNEKEVLIQHELSHIKRGDNFTGLIAMLLKDLLFFNPLAHVAYYLIRTEQERDSDRLVVRYSGKSKKEILKGMLNIILKIKSISCPKEVPGATHAFTLSPVNLFNHIKLKNRVNSISNTDPSRIYSRFLPRILMCILFVFLLLAQIIFVLEISGYFIFLR
jgi:beta-lactamase regulating signal transducer with metallopeptidase domain